MTGRLPPVCSGCPGASWGRGLAGEQGAPVLALPGALGRAWPPRWPGRAGSQVLCCPHVWLGWCQGVAFWGCLHRLVALSAGAALRAPLPSASGFPLAAGGGLRSKVSFLVPQPLLLPPGPVPWGLAGAFALLLGSRSVGLKEALSFGEAHVLLSGSADPSPGARVPLEELPAGLLLSGDSREVNDLSIRISRGGGGRCSRSSSVSQLKLGSSLLHAPAVSRGGKRGARGLQPGPTLRESPLAAGEIWGFGYKGESPLYIGNLGGMMGIPHFLRQGLGPESLKSPRVLRPSVGLKVSMSFLTDVLVGQLLTFQSSAPAASWAFSPDGVVTRSPSAFPCGDCLLSGWGLHFCKMLLA